MYICIYAYILYFMYLYLPIFGFSFKSREIVFEEAPEICVTSPCASHLIGPPVPV